MCELSSNVKAVGTTSMKGTASLLPQGVLRINQKNYEEAFIDDPVSAVSN